MEQNFEMLPANKDKTVQIKKIDADNYFLRLIRIDINPNDPQHPARREQIKLFTPLVWKNLQGFANDKNPVDWQKAAGVAESKVVHDPSLMTPEELKEIREYREQYFASRRPAPAQAGSLESAVAEIKRLKRKLKVH
jgi:hypothetical protein